MKTGVERLERWQLALAILLPAYNIQLLPDHNAGCKAPVSRHADQECQYSGWDVQRSFDTTAHLAVGAGSLLDHPPICAALVTAPRRLIMHQINGCMFDEERRRRERERERESRGAAQVLTCVATQYSQWTDPEGQLARVSRCRRCGVFVYDDDLK